MKNILNNLKLLGFVLFICSPLLKVLCWPGLILIALSTLGLLFYWRDYERSDIIWHIIVLITCVLVMAGI